MKNIFGDPTKEAHCVDYTGSKMTGPERLADVQQRYPCATYYANPSEQSLYKACIKYDPSVYCGWVAAVYEREEMGKNGEV